MMPAGDAPTTRRLIIGVPAQTTAPPPVPKTVPVLEQMVRRHLSCGSCCSAAWPMEPCNGTSTPFALRHLQNAEIFTLTYGALVRQLISDFEDLDEVNRQLETMGYNIGIRLVDEFLAKTRMQRCSSFKETAEVIAKQAFSMFLNVQASVTNQSADGKECSLVRRGSSDGQAGLQASARWRCLAGEPTCGCVGEKASEDPGQPGELGSRHIQRRAYSSNT